MFKKYRPVQRQDYEAWNARQEARRKQIAQDPMRLHYHLMPAMGWLNDPNGLCQFHGVYHLYYQYDPFDTEGALKLWAHVTTRDFIHYEEQEPFLFPDSELDIHGAYSGCAFIKDDQIHYFYTGNRKLFDRTDYDYIHNGRVSNTIHLCSPDGFHFPQKEQILGMNDYPSNLSQHIRDPKVWEQDGRYYMVLGARDQNDQGCALLYESDDLTRWTYNQRIQSKVPLGYMWECPDLFALDGTLWLVCCPQGVAKQGVDYANVHSCTAMRLSGTLKEGLTITHIQQLDRGFDFYAPQSFRDEQGRRILLAWMGIPDADYTNPSVKQGWQHALTLPRELFVKDGMLCQKPLSELQQLRTESYTLSKDALNALHYEEAVYELELSCEGCRSLRLSLSDEIHFSYEDGLFTCSLGTAGSGRTIRQAQLSSLRHLRLFSDTTSLELFLNEGQTVFTTRVYPNRPRCVTLKMQEEAQIRLHKLGAYQVKRPAGKTV